MAEKTTGVKRIAAVIGAGMVCSAVTAVTGQSVLGAEQVQKTAAEGIEENIDYTAMAEFACYAEILNEKGKAHNFNGGFALYDLDKDGVRELIISTGESDADWVNYVYAIEGQEAHSIGNFYAPVNMYEAEDGNGIYSVYGNMGYQIVSRITKKNGQIDVETVMENEIAEGEEYYKNDKEIPLTAFDAGSIPQESGETDSGGEGIFAEFGGYYTNLDSNQIINIYAQLSPELDCDGVLDVGKEAGSVPESGTSETYFLRSAGENTAVIVDAKKGMVTERGTIEFHDSELYIIWDTGYLTGTYSKTEK